MIHSGEPALRCRDIHVAYGDVIALTEIGIEFEQGMIHAVVGQNGAGKTTFARVAAGLVRPDAGTLSINGRELRFGRVASARDAGVELVHQNFALPPSFTVAEALEFGGDRGIGFFSRRQLYRRWSAHLDALELNVDPRSRIRDLPVETQQGVELARALVRDARVLILDEPTAVLSPPGIEALFKRIRKLKQRSVTVILILHKIREVFAVADTITILRGGKLIAGPIPSDQTDAAKIADLIIGSAAREMSRDDMDALVGSVGGAGAAQRGDPGGKKTSSRKAILHMFEVNTQGDSEGPPLDQVSLDVKAGEIVGIAGVEGNGQRTLLRAIANLAEVTAGNITLDGEALDQASLVKRRAMGLRIIPFERNTEGLSLTSQLWENWSARELMQRPLLSLINPARLREQCAKNLKSWGVHYASTTQNAGSLSGGNAQKVILAREIGSDARLIIAAQPTRGLDIGATSFVWSALREARARGCAVLMISSDLDELFDVCDRVLVMLSGRVVSEFLPPYDIGYVGRAMTGVS